MRQAPGPGRRRAADVVSLLVAALAACAACAACAPLHTDDRSGAAPQTVGASETAHTRSSVRTAADTSDGGAAALQADAATRAAAGDTVFRLDPTASHVRLLAFRSGASARLGHDHVLTAPQFDGYVALPPGRPAGGRFALLFRLDALTVDDPAERAALGGVFARPLSPEAVAGTRDHLLGVDNLQADRFPYVRIDSAEIVGDAPAFAAQVQVSLHGQQRPLWVALQVTGLPERLTVTGRFVLHQRDFGVQPYSVAGGLLGVADAVIVDFTLEGVPFAKR